MDSASVLPPAQRSFRRAVKALGWHLSALVTGTAPASVSRKTAEPSPPADAVDDVNTGNGSPAGRNSARANKYPPRRADFLEEAAMAREIFRL
jgi:hypothetical protein